MSPELSQRHRKALDALRSECDFEDSRVGGTANFIRRNQLPPGTGPKAVADLLALGLIEEGACRWGDDTGYRITNAGRETLACKPALRPRAPSGRKLGALPPRIGELKPRVGELDTDRKR